MKILEGNASALTNFEVLDFLRAKGASKDPTRVIAKVAQSEYKVYDYLVDTAASIQTRESINEFLDVSSTVPAEEEHIWGAFFKATR
ncbi:uncharacterized protein LOC114397204 [Glycine soja]|uniref:uncharacterized protein LOC114397204 n=1 Tax=Glycine soja TaxID=3848 RepID=UPI00103A56DA|nr:uncharacterized protein LOC114397204 [Glycine soja]